MKIAIASQNRRTVTGHVGRCRRFRLFDVEGGEVTELAPVELDKEGTLHGIAPAIPEPLQSVNVLIAAEMCDNMVARLQRNGMQTEVSPHSDPLQALQAFVDRENACVTP